MHDWVLCVNLFQQNEALKRPNKMNKKEKNEWNVRIEKKGYPKHIKHGVILTSECIHNTEKHGHQQTKWCDNDVLPP